MLILRRALLFRCHAAFADAALFRCQRCADAAMPLLMRYEAAADAAVDADVDVVTLADFCSAMPLLLLLAAARSSACAQQRRMRTICQKMRR